MKIQRIRIVGFKSIAEVTLNNLMPYSVFAGPNGAGKSNLTDALGFVGAIISMGAMRAIRKYNGFSQIHCLKFRKDKARTFEFQIDTTIYNDNISYSLKLHDMDTKPVIEEKLTVSGRQIMSRKKGDPPVFWLEDGVDKPLTTELNYILLQPQF